jgi:LmbE family N-acetylglucosaminyl deacetylase
VAPHPDDETIMCGATLAALRDRGDRVRVVAVTVGDATAVDHSPARARGGAGAAARGIGDVRAAELHAACAALGVDDVVVWDFSDRGVSSEGDRLAARIAEELEAMRPALVFAPFPHDPHPDHVAVALALADALDQGRHSAAAGDTTRSPTTVLLGAVQLPLSPGWATRLVAADAAWAARMEAVEAYASRGRRVFLAPTQLARLHPARPLRATEAFVELPASSYVGLARAMEAEGLTTPGMRGGGHPLALASELVRTRRQRDAVTALLRSAVSER